MKDLERLKQIFLTDVDPDTHEENMRQIQEWESALIKHDAYQAWKSHDITKSIAAKAREAYVEASMLLANRRDADDATRQSLWAKKDAALWILTLIEADSGTSIEAINMQVRRALEKASEIA